MEMSAFLPYLLVMAGVTYLIRALPLVLVRKKIKNRFFPNKKSPRSKSADKIHILFKHNLQSHRKPASPFCQKTDFF